MALMAMAACIWATDAAAQPLAEPFRAPATECDYQTVAMLVKYTGEEVAGGYYETAVRYFTPEESRKYEVFVQDGLLVNAAGLPVDWARAEYTDEYGAALFAIYSMDECGRIYLTYHHEVGIVHHSSFTSGTPIASGGEALIVDGRLLDINNGSGHYRPRPVIALQVLHRLKSMGTDLSMVEVNMMAPRPRK